MARRLQEVGEGIELLALLDAGPGASKEMARDDAEHIMRVLAEELPLSEEELRAMADLDERLRHVIAVAEREGVLPEGWDLTTARRVLAVRRAHQRAVYRYQPRPYPGRLILFSAADRPPELLEAERRDPTRGWGKLCAGGVEVIRVSGRHNTLVARPHVEILAMELKSCLERLRSADMGQENARGVSRTLLRDRKATASQGERPAATARERTPCD